MIRRSFLALTLAVVAAPAWAQFDTMTQKPIVAAVRSGDEEKVRQALLKGENPNQIDASGRPLLMIAVMDGDGEDAPDDLVRLLEASRSTAEPMMTAA